MLIRHSMLLSAVAILVAGCEVTPPNRPVLLAIEKLEAVESVGVIRARLRNVGEVPMWIAGCPALLQHDDGSGWSVVETLPPTCPHGGRRLGPGDIFDFVVPAGDGRGCEYRLQVEAEPSLSDDAPSGGGYEVLVVTSTEFCLA